MICPRCHTNAYIADYCHACSYEPVEVIPESILKTLASDNRMSGQSKRGERFEPKPERKRMQSAAAHERATNSLMRRTWTND